MAEDAPLPAWRQPFWQTLVETYSLSIAEEGLFRRYLERPQRPPPTSYVALEAAYAAFCHRHERAC
jgi:hypothetical protein